MCCLQGAQALINATVKQEFAQAPPSIRSSFQALELKHSDDFSNILMGKLNAVRGDSNARKPDATGPGANACRARE